MHLLVELRLACSENWYDKKLNNYTTPVIMFFPSEAASFVLYDLPMHIARCRPEVVASLQTYLGLLTL